MPRQFPIIAAGLVLATATLMVPTHTVSAKVAQAAKPGLVSGATPLPAKGAAGACGSEKEFQNWEKEPSLSVNPMNPDNLATAYVQDFDDAIVVAYSTDGGGQWAKALPRTTACTWPNDDRPAEFQQYNSAINPWLSFGTSAANSQGIAYLTSGVNNFDLGVSTAVVHRSTTGGRTWSDPHVLDRAARPLGIEFTNVTADPNRGATPTRNGPRRVSSAARATCTSRAPRTTATHGRNHRWCPRAGRITWRTWGGS